MSERDAADLALTPYEIARLLADESGVTDPEAALRVADLTAGWPTLVRFAGDALGRDAHVDLATAMTAPGAPAADWIRCQRPRHPARRRGRRPPRGGGDRRDGLR